MINQYDYFCPKCDEKLSESNQVVFTIQRNNEKSKIFLEPKPGSYSIKCQPECTFVLNEEVDFFCPYCEENLKSDRYSKFVEIILKVTDSVIFDVFFSRIYGDHTTYVGIEDFEEEYGDKIASH